MAVPFDAGILLGKKGLLGQLNFRLHIIQKKSKNPGRTGKHRRSFEKD